MKHKGLGLSPIRETTISYRPEGETPKSAPSNFFRGENCNFNPHASDHAKQNFCEHFVLKGLLPSAPVVRARSRITAFGSCFAANITRHLSGLGFDLSRDREPNIYISLIGEGLVNVHAILTQFEWALEDRPQPANLWHGRDTGLFTLDPVVQRRTRDVFLATEVFIITIGVSEIWYDEVSGGVFWRAVPMEHYDAARHKFRVCSVAETKAAIQEITRLIRLHCNAEVIFTLSPIPLLATFRPQSCITANAASKAILRAAFDEFFRDPAIGADPRVHYFPAYEMVTELFPIRYQPDCHHPYPLIIDAVMKVFEAFYCDTALSREDAERELRKARASSAQLCAADGCMEPLPNPDLDHARQAFLDAVAVQEVLKDQKRIAENSLAEAQAKIARLEQALTLSHRP